MNRIKYWDYEDYNGGLEDCISELATQGCTIQSVTIMKYAEAKNAAKQNYMFPIRALIVYNK